MKPDPEPSTFDKGAGWIAGEAGGNLHFQTFDWP